MTLRSETLEDLRAATFQDYSQCKDPEMAKQVRMEVDEFISNVNEIVADFQEQPLDEEHLSCITVWLFQKLADINNPEN